MGYNMHQREAKFRIKSENFTKALEAVHGLARQQPHYSWVTSSSVLHAETLPSALSEWRWNMKVVDNDVVSLYFEGDKLGDEDTLFNALAPFVESGCYIEMMGEDDSMWRWVFKDGACRQVNPTVEWD